MSAPHRPPGTTIGPADPNEVIRDAYGRVIAGVPFRNSRYNPAWDPKDPRQGAPRPARQPEQSRGRVPAGGRWYDPSRGLYEQDDYTATPSTSPVAQALAEARRRAVQGANSTARQSWLSVERDKMTNARFTASGGRISDQPGRTTNIFTDQYTQQMREAAATVFDALNMDAITGDLAYNVGTVTTEKANPWEGHDTGRIAEMKARAGVKPVSAVESMVQNTIAGGIADFQRMSAQNPDTYNAMVYRLWQAGLISGKVEDAGLGGWTPGAGKALATAMSSVAQLNQQGIPTTLDEYVDSLITGREQALTEFAPAEPPPPPRQYTSRDELNSRLKSTAQEVLGRALSDEEADKFASAFRGKEDAAYTQAEAGKNYENPNATASAQTYVEAGNETEAAAFRIQGFMERLKQEMGL